MVTATAARVEAEEALLDAAERLLVSVGYASLSTRLVAKEAAVNHGLVHYYFGSMENLLLRVLERFTERLIERQRAMYSRADIPSSTSGARRWASSRRTSPPAIPRSGSSYRPWRGTTPSSASAWPRSTPSGGR